MVQTIVLTAVMKIHKYVQNTIVTTSLIEQYVQLDIDALENSFFVMETKYLEQSNKTDVMKILMKMKKYAQHIVQRRNSNLFVLMDMVAPCVQMAFFAL